MKIGNGDQVLLREAMIGLSKVETPLSCTITALSSLTHLPSSQLTESARLASIEKNYLIALSV